MRKLKSWLGKLKFQDVVPFVAFIVIFVFFTIASYNERTGTVTMLTMRNLRSLLDQTMQTILEHVVSQGLGRKAGSKSFKVAGKTGTAQVATVYGTADR